MQPAERLVFASAFESLFQKSLDGRVSPTLKSGLLELGVNLDRPLLPAYPLETWIRALQLTVQDLFPDEPPERAFEQLAALVISGYEKTLLGRATLAMMRLVGPDRCLKRFAQGLHTTDNYSEVELTPEGPGAYTFRINLVSETPRYVESLVEGILRTAGAKAPRMELMDTTQTHSTFRVGWAP
jgi:uncharacterized protein (TIGR02265 family)